jgi:ElaA protein
MYTRHGFVRAGEEYVDDGVPHVPMLKPGTHTDEAP